MQTVDMTNASSVRSIRIRVAIAILIAILLPIYVVFGGKPSQQKPTEYPTVVDLLNYSRRDFPVGGIVKVSYSRPPNKEKGEWDVIKSGQYRIIKSTDLMVTLSRIIEETDHGESDRLISAITGSSYQDINKCGHRLELEIIPPPEESE